MDISTPAPVMTIAGESFDSALMAGSAGYPNRQIMLDALAASGAEKAWSSCWVADTGCCPTPPAARRRATRC
jgi:hypothetical protein